MAVETDLGWLAEWSFCLPASGQKQQRNRLLEGGAHGDKLNDRLFHALLYTFVQSMLR